MSETTLKEEAQAVEVQQGDIVEVCGVFYRVKAKTQDGLELANTGDGKPSRFPWRIGVYGNGTSNWPAIYSIGGKLVAVIIGKSPEEAQGNAETILKALQSRDEKRGIN